MSKILVDGVEYPTKERALKHFLHVMACSKGVDNERYTFAYQKIKEGCDSICTFSGYAIKR